MVRAALTARAAILSARPQRKPPEWKPRRPLVTTERPIEKQPIWGLAAEAGRGRMQWLPPETYVNLLQQSGFDQVRARQEMVNLSLDGVRDLGRYWLFIEGALPGVPLALGATALSTTVEQVASELGMTAVPRLWLQLLASKA